MPEKKRIIDEKLLEDAKNNITNQMLIQAYTSLKHPSEKELIRKAIDGGEDKSLDYYRGVDHMVNIAGKLILDLSDGNSTEFQTISYFMAYCTYKIQELENKE